MEAKDFNLEAVPVRVTNVNFDGLGRTKADFVARAVDNVFQSNTFGELIMRVGEAQDTLRRLEVFREVGTIIDVDKSDANFKTKDNYHVTFVVQEFNRIAASARTQMGAQADAQVKTGVRMPNLFGRGERLEVEYSYSSNKEKNTEISVVKPILGLRNGSLKGSLFHSRSANIYAANNSDAVGALLTFYCQKTNEKLGTLHHKLEYEGIWRYMTPLHSYTPYLIRWECGHSFKSAVRHVLTFDGRDQPIFPNIGMYMNVLQEFAGFFGDSKYHKIDVDLQHNYPLSTNMVFQSALRIGLITPFGKDDRNCGMADRFFSGGPYSLRGFDIRGVNIGEEGIALGNLTHWSSAIHLYARFPYLNRKFPMVDNCRLHFFVNGGNVADKLLSGNVMKYLRVACGMGLAVALGNFGRLELNYCLPLKYTEELDDYKKGMQIGVGVHFL